MNTHHLGSCLCGAVSFRIDGTFDRFYLCHCEYCRKDSGSAHSANLFSATARLEWLSGPGEITRFNLPGTRHTKSFCRVCGSAMPYTLGGLLVVPAGALSTTVDNRPDGHAFVASRAGWDHALADLPAFDAFPA